MYDLVTVARVHRVIVLMLLTMLLTGFLYPRSSMPA